MKVKFLKITLICALFMLLMPVIANAQIIDSGSCGADGPNVTWTLDDEGTLTISGEGDMKDYYSYPYAPWYDIRSSITKVVIEQSVTSIGSHAFVGCSDLTSIDIPNSVTSIEIR